jgi:amino acid transporter
MVVPTATLADSDGALLEVVRLGPLNVPEKLFSGIALLAVANGALINLIMASRLVYGMAKQGIVPRAFERVHHTRKTPWVAILFTAGLCMALILLGDLSDLAATTVTLLLLVFAAVNVAVLVLRREQVTHRHFHAPTIFPILGTLVIAGLLTQREGRVFLFAIGLLAIGVIFWFASRFISGREPTIDATELEG